MVELMGHRREVGFVTTENYGAASLFRVDSPALPERDFVLDRPSYAWQVDPDTKKRAEHFVPAGTKVHREAVPPKSCLVGPGSIYAINPCTEDAALHAIETMIERPLILVALPKDYNRKALRGAYFSSLCEAARHDECSEFPECTCNCHTRLEG